MSDASLVPPWKFLIINDFVRLTISHLKRSRLWNPILVVTITSLETFFEVFYDETAVLKKTFFFNFRQQKCLYFKIRLNYVAAIRT